MNIAVLQKYITLIETITALMHKREKYVVHSLADFSSDETRSNVTKLYIILISTNRPRPADRNVRATNIKSNSLMKVPNRLMEVDGGSECMCANDYVTPLSEWQWVFACHQEIRLPSEC